MPAAKGGPSGILTQLEINRLKAMLTWADITGKPTTFAPTLPIAQSGVTGLVSDLAGKATPTDITNAINALVNGAPAALDTLKELADRFAVEDSDQAVLTAALALRLRVDAAQSLTSPQQAQGRSNLGLGSAALRDESYFALASSAIALATAAGLAATPAGSVGVATKAAREDHTHPLFAVTPSTSARTLNTNFTPHATKPVLVSYTIKTQVTNPLIAGSSTAMCQLLSDSAATPTTERGRVAAESSVALAVAIAITTSNTATLTYLVPPGQNVRLASAITGTATVSIISQVEEVLG